MIRFLMDMLEQMIRWVEEVPALEQSNQRFGNLAFRSYYKLIEEVSSCSLSCLGSPVDIIETTPNMASRHPSGPPGIPSDTSVPRLDSVRTADAARLWHGPRTCIYAGAMVLRRVWLDP